ncbi:MAG: alpha-L-fucosidase [Niabella sp.]
MIRLFILFLGVFFYTTSWSQEKEYIPSSEIVKARSDFQDMKYGLFIHWGPSSVLGAGEWVMNNRNIKVKDYKRLVNFYNPVHYSAGKWVSMAKAAGMKYITFVSRHHDSFSNWDTHQSNWKITNTPYGKDVLKMLAEECKAQGMKLALYYSTLDWFRDDYPHETGRTGKGTGRTGKGDYTSYLKFMKAQLTELLTNYGDIAAIWFDGHWDQTNPEGNADRNSRIDWKYDEIYSLIHQLQPGCMIGNNHHLTPFPGEDFQMFERDLPGENKAGFSYQKASENLPLETCETINGSWGYNITDDKYKTVEQVVHYVVNAAGRNANLLLNVGPMPDGTIQPEFVDTLLGAGKWLQQYGETIYGTRGMFIPPQPWGVATTKGNKVYLHILKKPQNDIIRIDKPGIKIKSVVNFDTKSTVKCQPDKNGATIFVGNIPDNVDYIIELTIK